MKPDNLKAPLHVDYVGFRIPPDFVVGYGLDAAGRHRNLPYVGVHEGDGADAGP